MANETNEFKILALGLVGAVIGGCLGYFTFFWLTRQGFYGLMLPPAMLGLGAGLCARRRSMPLALFCGAAGLALGLFTEWRFAPFRTDGSLSYFFTHLQELRQWTVLTLAAGTFLAGRLALGFDPKPAGAA